LIRVIAPRIALLPGQQTFTVLSPIPQAGWSAMSTTIAVNGELMLRFPSNGGLPLQPGSPLTGTTTGDLSGDVDIRIIARQPIPGSARTFSAAIAEITITRPDGILKGAAAGGFDVATGEFHNVTAWIGGTGRYVNARGLVRFEGVVEPRAGVARETYQGNLSF
jgi:hypothetical protein